MRFALCELLSVCCLKSRSFSGRSSSAQRGPLAQQSSIGTTGAQRSSSEAILKQRSVLHEYPALILQDDFFENFNQIIGLV